MAKNEEVELTILSEKGQVVIPAKIRSKMGLKPKTKFLVYECNDSVVLKTLREPDFSKELEAIYKRVDEKIAEYGELPDEEINRILHERRQRKKPSK